MKHRIPHFFALLCANGSLFATEDSSSSPSAAADRAAIERVYYNHRLGTKQPFEQSLPAELQNVLSAQLRQPGDVSAVIETPGAFQIYLARDHSAESLSATLFTLRKRSYEEWLVAQHDP